MNLKITGGFLLAIFSSLIFSSDAPTEFFLLHNNLPAFNRSSLIKVLLPIPRHPSLDLANLVSCKRTSLNSRLALIFIPQELKNKFKLPENVEIVGFSNKFSVSKYLEFYFWLTDDLSSYEIHPDFAENILYFLNYFNCKDVELVIKLFKFIRNQSQVTYYHLGKLHEGLEKVNNIKNLFSILPDENVMIALKNLVYNSGLKEVLADGTYEIVTSENSGCFEICLKNTDAEKNKDHTRLEKLDKENNPKIKIVVYSNILEAVISKRLLVPKGFDYGMASFETCIKIFEALEFLATKHKLMKKSCAKGSLYLERVDDGRLHFLDSPVHGAVAYYSYIYPAFITKIRIHSQVCDAKEVLNALEICKEGEIILVSEVCEIKDLEDVKKILECSKYVKVTRDTENNETKLVKHKILDEDQLIPVFLKVIFKAGANKEEIKSKYVAEGLEKFWGPTEVNKE